MTNSKENAAEVYGVPLGGAKIVLIIGLVGGLATFALPHAGDVLGFNVLTNTGAAADMPVTMPERIYSICLTLFTVLGTATVLATRNALLSYISAAGSFFAFGFSIFSVWMRQTGPGSNSGFSPSIGLFVGMLSAFLVCAALVTIVFKRTPAQIAAAEARTTQARRVEAELENNLIAHRPAVPETPDTAATEVDERRKRHRGRQNKSQSSPE